MNLSSTDVRYLNLVNKILCEGELVKNRTGVDTLSLLAEKIDIDLENGFPLLTTKKMKWKSIVSELLWFLEGSTDERRLAEILYDDSRYNLSNKKTIWTDNADFQGRVLGYENNDFVKELGPIYGYQWRVWSDQISIIDHQIKNERDSRRIVLSAWNVSDLPYMSLPPCHLLYQFFVRNGTLSCVTYQRSADVGLGLPYNIASAALLTNMFATSANLKPKKLTINMGDAHIYVNHIDALSQQLKRIPFKPPNLKLPLIKDMSLETIKTLNVNDFKLENYKHHEFISMKMAI